MILEIMNFIRWKHLTLKYLYKAAALLPSIGGLKAEPVTF